MMTVVTKRINLKDLNNTNGIKRKKWLEGKRRQQLESPIEGKISSDPCKFFNSIQTQQKIQLKQEIIDKHGWKKLFKRTLNKHRAI